jgi:hypothetical protein
MPIWDIVNSLIPGIGFKSGYTYAEGYAKPAVSLNLESDDEIKIYGRVSGIASFTLGEDIFGSKDVAAFGLEDAYLGMQVGSKESLYADISGGRMPYKLGNGAVLNDGGIDGSRTGALLFMPYQAWAQAGVVKIGHGGLSVTGFFLDAHEIATPDTETSFAGWDVRYDIDAKQFAGVTFGEVVTSNIDYPQSVPGGLGFVPIVDGRDGLRFANIYAKGNPLGKSAPGFFLSGDFVYQWHKRYKMGAYAIRARVGNQFANAPLKPTISYGITYSSGDDGDTAKLERFDALQGGGDDWAVGTSSGLLLANSNLTVHRFQVDTILSPQDYLTFKYFHIRGNELNAPLAFDPDADFTPPPFVIAGSKAVANDFGVEYTHAFSGKLMATATVYYSEPVKGLENLAGADLKGWLAAAIMLRAIF